MCEVAASRSAQPSPAWKIRTFGKAKKRCRRSSLCIVPVPGPGRAEHQTGILLATSWAGRVTAVAGLFQWSFDVHCAEGLPNKQSIDGMERGTTSS